VPVQFSLFEGDGVDRLLRRFGLDGQRVTGLIGRCALLLLVTWVSLAFIVLGTGVGRSGPPGANFFLDFAAYLQFVVGLPLFVIAERVVAERTREAAWFFASTGLLDATDEPRLSEIHARLASLRCSLVPDVVCGALAWTLSYVTIHPELRASLLTWHTVVGVGGARAYSAAGWWEMLVALPVLDFWWLRWIWKIILWCVYLFWMSRFRLTLPPTHPDNTGGLGFLSDTQTNFGLVILAYGVSNIASTVGYKIVVEHASAGEMTVWGPFVLFIVCAPLLFTMPLFLFTRQLRQAKRRAIEAYAVLAMAGALRFEREGNADAPGRRMDGFTAKLSEYNQLRQLYDHVQAMRVVPFDLRSFSELVGYATGPFLPLLTLTEKLESPPVKWLIDKLSGK
jgi:hypothetical protein